MNPVSPDSDNDHSQQPDPPASSFDEDLDRRINGAEEASDTSSSPSFIPPVKHNRRWTDTPTISPLENLQRRYTDQLSQDIEQLEAEKAQLQEDIATLKQDYQRRQAEAQAAAAISGPSISESGPSISGPIADPISESTLKPTAGEKVSKAIEIAPQLNNSPSSIAETAETVSAEENISTTERGPRLPGEKEVPPPPMTVSPAARTSAGLATERRVELPTPATSQRQRQLRDRGKIRSKSITRTTGRRQRVIRAIAPWAGSAIATLITAWHYGLVSTLHQGGSWLGITIEQLGVGFVPAVALLWLRMLVIVPSMVLIAPQLHRTTWEDLLDWVYSPEQLQKQLFMPLVGSGIALFFSQVLLYQSIATIGPAIGTALLFLYPLSAIPLGLSLKQEKALTPFGLLAGVAIAMGGLLVAKPAFTTAPTAVGLGVLASLALSSFIVLTNRCYRLRCHPIPTAIVQFSTVAVLSSLVLLVKPLKLVSISWMSFCLWGLLLGVLMLIAYLLTYTSLLNIRSKTAIVAAATPLVALILGLSFLPRPPLQIIQWTGIVLIAIGGIALSKEKLGRAKET